MKSYISSIRINEKLYIINKELMKSYILIYNKLYY